VFQNLDSSHYYARPPLTIVGHGVYNSVSSFEAISEGKNVKDQTEESGG